MFAELFKNKNCMFLWSIFEKQIIGFLFESTMTLWKKYLQHDEEICVKNFVYFYRSVTYFFTEKSLEGLKQIHQEVCSQHKSIFNLECCMIFSTDLQWRQLFSTFLNPVSSKSEPCPGALDTPRLWDRSLSWTLCLTQWHWGLFCLLLNPQLWCWNYISEMPQGVVWFLFPLFLLPLYPPDWPWGNCAQGTSGEPIPCPCIHN